MRDVKVIIFGATGMLGLSVLQQCLHDFSISEVLTIGRHTTGIKNKKLREIQQFDLLKYDLQSAPSASQLAGFDACFFCLGASAADVNEENYRKINYDMPLAAAQALLRLNPQMVFVYVSGANTDSTEKGRSMWARVKGATENALLALPFRGAYMMRPGLIIPMPGIKSKTKAYRLFYSVTGPILPLLHKMFPRSVMTAEQISQAMIVLAKQGNEKKVLEATDIIDLAQKYPL